MTLTLLIVQEYRRKQWHTLKTFWRRNALKADLWEPKLQMPTPLSLLRCSLHLFTMMRLTVSCPLVTATRPRVRTTLISTSSRLHRRRSNMISMQSLSRILPPFPRAAILPSSPWLRKLTRLKASKTSDPSAWWVACIKELQSSSLEGYREWWISWLDPPNPLSKWEDKS